MFSRFDYPVFLAPGKRQCLIAGFGEVGQRKLAGLLDAGADNVLVLDPYHAECPLIDADRRIRLEKRNCEAMDIAASFLVFACTSCAEENSRIMDLCKKARVLCNSASNPAGSDFIVPAVARRHGLTAALSTGGQSPALARRWRQDLQEWLGERGKLAWIMGKLREPVLAAGLTQKENAKLFHMLAASPMGSWLAENDAASCRIWLKDNAPELPPDIIDQIFSEYTHVFS